MDHVGASLKRKLGPLPVWGWAIIAGVVLYYVRNRHGGGMLGGSSSSGDGTGSSTGTLSSGAAGGGAGDESSLSLEIQKLEHQLSKDEGTIARLRKRLRNKGKPKHHHGGGRKHRAGPQKPQLVKKPQTHVPMRSSGTSRRDRTHIALSGIRHRAVKTRGHAPGHGVVAVAPTEASFRHEGRTGETQLANGARTHFGGPGSVGVTRNRSDSPPAPGRNVRARSLDSSSHEHVEHEPPARSSSRVPAPRHTAPAAPKGRPR